jgi:hypothetical protein
MSILKRHSEKGKSRPKMFPGTVREAAQYWIGHQPPPDDYREGVKKIIKNEELVGYETPYHDRLARTLCRFLVQKHIHQLFIIEAIERGIPWRGDEIGIYTEIVKEADKMLKDPESYIEEAWVKLKQFKFKEAT